MRCFLPPRSLAALSIKRACFHILISAAVGCALGNINARAQGFGVLKLEGRLERVNPPHVYFPNAQVFVQIESAQPINSAILQSLHESIEIALRPRNAPLPPTATGARLLIVCRIQEITSDSRVESRTRSVYKKIGEHTVHDETANTDTTVEDFGNVEESYQAAIDKGRLIAAYRARDPDVGMTLDADTLTTNYHQETENGTPASADAIHQALIYKLAADITARFRYSNNQVSVLLPKGKLKDASTQLREGRWNMALALLNAMPPFKQSKDEAYRLYDFGVVYEGLAYQQGLPMLTLAYLQRAADYYVKAAQQAPDERRFREAQWRIESSVNTYQDLLARFRKQMETRDTLLRQQGKVLPPDAGSSAATVPIPAVVNQTATPQQVAAYKGVATLTNEVIIKWVKAGLSTDDILTNIQQSRSNRFDFSAKALGKLKQAGVSDRTVQAMSGYQTPRQPGRKGFWIVQMLLTFWPYLPLIF